MMKVLLVFLFFNPNHELVDAQLDGAGPNVAACQAHAAEIIDAQKSNLPEDITVFPLCVNTSDLFGDKNPTENQKQAGTKL